MENKLNVYRGCDLEKSCLECSGLPPCSNDKLIVKFNIAQQAQGGEDTKPCPRCIDIVNYPCKSDNIWGDGEEQIFFCPLCGRKLSWGTASPVR